MRTTLLVTLAAASLLTSACGGADASSTSTPAADGPAAATAAPSGWVDADLSAGDKKLPLVVKAPQGYTLATSPLGDVELSSETVTFDVDDVTSLGADGGLAAKKADVQANSGMVFEKFVLEEPDGFIARMGADNYIPVRVLKRGDHLYQFSVIPLNALPSEEAARELYAAAALSRAK